MSELKTYSVLLVTKGFYAGSVEAASLDDAVARTRETWCTADLHSYEQYDEELVSVIAEEEE